MTWRSGHAREFLTAYCQGELDRAEADRVAEHLRACATCRADLETIRFGIALATRLEPVAAPDDLRGLVRNGLEKGKTPLRGRFRLVAAALVLAGIILVLNFPSRVYFSAETAAPSAFELAARDLHLARSAVGFALDVTESDPRKLRSWIEAAVTLHADLAVERPTEDGNRFAPLGAKRIDISGVPGVLVAYRVDDLPVTLVTLRERDLPGAPSEEWFAKGIHFRTVDGLKILTWARDGQAYALVSALPSYGETSCFLCHTAPERRALIRDIRREIQP